MITLVLVEPLFAGNLGAVARIAANFDVTDLVLVRPQCSPLDDEALKYAVGVPAKTILHNARIVDTLSAALAQCSLSVAFVRKDNRSPKTTSYVEKVLSALSLQPQRVALVFGKEDHGLSNQDSELCTFEASIHTSNTYPSMNLSHAVAVVLHQVFTERATHNVPNSQSDLAPHQEVETLIDHLRTLMVDAEITTGDNPDKLLRPMALVLRRSGLTQRDIGHFRAFFSKTQNALERARKPVRR